MIVVLLVLLNLSTLVLLDSLEDSLQSWRLTQHDIHVARAERALQSSLAFALTQLHYGMQVPATLQVGESWRANITAQQQECSAAYALERECVRLLVEIVPQRQLGPLQQISRTQALELRLPHRN